MADFTAGFYDDWKTISIGVSAIAILASAGLIMLSRLFALKNLEQVAKTEFVYAASTVLIVIMAVGMINVAEPRLGGPSNSLARTLYLSSFCLPTDTDYIFQEQTTLVDWMKLYMATPTKCVQKFMDILYALEVPIGAVASVYMEIFMSEHASGFGVKWIEERILNATQSFSFFMYIFFLISHVMTFVKYYAGFFFSIGVALRAFPPTRGAGAYVMALSFGLYFVFPLTYILITTLGMSHIQSNIINCDTASVSGPEYICSLPEPADVTPWQCGTADAGKMMEFSNLIKAQRNELSTMISVKLIDFEKHLVNSLCIFPFVAFVVLLTFVLNTTALFGGNIPEIGRGLVKLI